MGTFFRAGFKTLAIFGIALLAGIGIFLSIWFQIQPRGNGVTRQTVLSTIQQTVSGVLGWDTRRYTRGSIILRPTDSAWGRGGLIPIPVTDEPAIDVDVYNIKEPVDVVFDIYKASKDDIFRYLTHDDTGNQTSSDVDVSGKEKIGSVTRTFSPDSTETSRVRLPIGEKDVGIWYVRATRGSTLGDAFVVRSDFGVTAAEENNAILFWGQDFVSKRSVDSGSVALYSLLGSANKLAEVPFSGQGIAKIPVYSEADIALVTRPSGIAVVPINLRYLNENYRFTSYAPKQKQYKYFVFTDRPIYKPGDKVYFKAIIRDDDDAQYSIPTGLASVTVVKDWDEKNPILTTSLPVSKEGTVTGDFVVPKDKGAGYYQITVRIGEVKKIYWWEAWENNSVGFRVEEYRKPEYHIDVATEKTQYISGDTVNFTVSGSYFSGQPITGSAKYKIVSSDTYDPVYQSDILNNDYWFEYGGWYGEQVSSGNISFAGGGIAQGSFVLPASNNGKNRIITIESEYVDGSGNPASAVKSVLVRPAEFSLYRTDHYTSGTIGREISIPVILVSNRETNISGRKLTVSVNRKYWEKQSGSEEKYPRLVEKTENVKEFSVTTKKDGTATLSFTPQKTGSYEWKITAEDNKGNSIIRTFYSWVSSVPAEGETMGNDQFLKVSTDKDRYIPGDTAHITIESSFGNRDMLLLVERGRVRRFQVVRMEGTQAEVSLPLQTTDMPNVFLTARSFSPTGLDEYSVDVEVSALQQKTNLSIRTDKSSYNPGDTATVTLTATDSQGRPVQTDAALWAIDKALFELVDASTETIFQAFWNKRGNGTVSTHSLEGIFVNQAEGGGCFAEGSRVTMADGSKKAIETLKPGDRIASFDSPQTKKILSRKVTAISKKEDIGTIIINKSLSVTPDHYLFVNNGWMQAGSVQGGDTLLGIDGNPVPVTSVEWVLGKTSVYNLEIEGTHTYFVDDLYVHNQKGDGSGRSKFEDTAYWNPSVKTDSQGKATVRFKLPDNLTTWVVSAVAANADTQVGDGKAEILVTKQIIIRPIVPNLLRVGDKGMVGALVQNYSGFSRQFTVSLAASGLSVLDAPRTITIPIGGTEEIWWKVEAKNPDGTNTLTFTAADSAKDGDSITIPLPVVAPVFIQKQGFVGIGSKDFTLNRFSDTNTNDSELTLFLSPTIIGTLPQSLSSLMLYPYDCSEQTATKVLAALISKTLPGVDVKDKEKLDTLIKKGIERLGKLQNSDGGWDWWEEGSSLPFLSEYVGEVLVEAKKQGYDTGDILTALDSYAQRLLLPRQAGTPKEKEMQTLLFGSMLRSMISGKNKESLYAFPDSDIPDDILARVSYWRIQSGDMDNKTNGIDTLLSRAIRQGDSASWKPGERSRFGSQDLTTALVIRALVTGKQTPETILPAVRHLVSSRRSEFWTHTLATVESVRALLSYYQASGEGSPNETYRVLLDGVTLGQGSITNVSMRPSVSVPVEKISQKGSTLRIEQSGTGQLYHSGVFHQYRDASKVTPQSNGGVRLTREYIGEDGSKGSFSLGEIVTVRLTIEGLEGAREYGVLEDHLPAGMVAVNTTLKNDRMTADRTRDNFQAFHMEIGTDSVYLTLHSIPNSQRVYEYQARVVTSGKYFAPPAQFNLMYEPSVYANTGGNIVTIANTKYSPKPAAVPGSASDWIKRNERVLFIAAVGMLLVLAATTIFLFSRLYGKK